jgi:hypothetical protein
MAKTILIANCVALALCLAVTGGTSAQPGGVPKLNVDPVCRGIAQQAGTPGERGGPDLGYRQCIASEMAMRRKLMKEWPAFRVTDRIDCVGAEMGALPSYTDLLTCLQMAKEARKLNNN